jgi:hypothetical protein
MHERQTCVDCQALSPETETNYTLISARYGWRLSRRRDARGKLVMEWRCPKCWRAYKGGGGDAVATPLSGEMAAFESPSGTRSVVPPADDDVPTLVDKSKRRSKSTVPPSRRGRAR